MDKGTRRQAARDWLRLVRGEGDAQTKRAYLLEKGLGAEEITEVLEQDEAEQMAALKVGSGEV